MGNAESATNRRNIAKSNRILELLEQRLLVAEGQTRDDAQHISHLILLGSTRDPVPPHPLNECFIIHGSKIKHDELAVEAIHQTAVSRNDRVEVLLAVRSLDGGGEEASEGSDQRREDGEDEFVQVDGTRGEALDLDDVRERLREGVEVGLVVVGKRAVGVVEGTVEVRDLDAVDDDLADDHRANAAADKPFPALVGRERRQRLLDESAGETDRQFPLLAEEHAAEVRHRVIGDDGRGREDEPDEAVHHHRNHGADLENDDHDGEHGPSDLTYA